MPPHRIHDWSNKGRGMCYPVCGMMHIKDPCDVTARLKCDCSGVNPSRCSTGFVII